MTGCVVSDCALPLQGKQRMCSAHWSALPAKLRQQLTFTDVRSRVGRDLWARACAIAAAPGGDRSAPPFTDPDTPTAVTAGASAPHGRPVETKRSRPKAGVHPS